MLIEQILIAVALLLLASILASKFSDRFGVPALLLFLLLGMLTGSEGLGGIYFDDPTIAQTIGVVALVLILFSGGLDTDWKSIQPVMRPGIMLSTVGVLLTAVIVGLFSAFVLGFSIQEGLLLGAIVSSTDAAAVFSVLRSKGISLKHPLKPLLELESGSNDPMAIFLTLGLIRLVMDPASSFLDLVGLFFLQMTVGFLMGYGMSRFTLVLLNRLKLGYEGLYPVLTLASVLLTYGLTNALGGNGFLAVYLAGMMLRRDDFIHRRSLIRFHDGLAWLMQIAMFLTLGLLVFPSRLASVAGVGFLIAGCLMFVARPLAVMICMTGAGMHLRKKLLVAWVGLRGAVPIILATYPLLARVPHADLIFNVVFFVVLTSVLLQGTTIPAIAKKLGVYAPMAQRITYPIEFNPMEGLKSELKELPITPDSPMAGKAVVELGLPPDFLIILIARDNGFLISSGGSVLQPGDTILVLSDKASLKIVREKFRLSEG